MDENKDLNFAESVEHPSEDYDEDLVTRSLGKVSKGAGVLFFGTVIGLFFGFLAQILIARFYSPEEYGLFNLFFTVLSIFSSIGVLGLRNGISRYIGYYLGSKESEHINSVEGWGLLIGTIGGISFGAILYVSAPWIGPLFSESPAFVDYLRIAALAMPFYVLLIVLTSIFRGFQRTREQILFFDLGKNAVFLLLSGIIGFMALPFVGIIWAMFLAITLMMVTLTIYYLQKRKDLFDTAKRISLEMDMGKKIILFSIPLVIVDIMYKVLGWTDTLMIGYFITDADVGFYNVAKILATTISIASGVAHFIYTPLVAGLYAQKKFKENDVIYTTLTKWLCFISLPITLLLIFFPNEIIDIFFGIDYADSVIPLQILAIIYFINILMGPNGATLTAYGKTNFLMYATSASGGFNIALNVLLIPIYGIIGAAIATGISILSINVIRVYKLKAISGVHSLKSATLKPVVLTVLVSVLLALILGLVPVHPIIILVIAIVVFYFIFLSSMLFTHTVSKEDIRLLNMVEDKIGIDLGFLRNLLRRFF